MLSCPLTVKQVQSVITGARERAAKLGARVTVAVVDEGGHLQAFAALAS